MIGAALSDGMPVALGSAWALLLALPLVRRAARTAPAARAAALRRTTRLPPREPAASPRETRLGRLRSRGRRDGRAGVLSGAATGVVGRVVSGLRGRRTARRADAAIRRELPVVLDLLGVAVGAGCTPYLAVESTARWAPPDLGARFDRVLRACRLGAAFPDALEEVAGATPALRPLVDALLASDRLGAPVGPALARLADEERAASRRRAEAHARRVPVRLLFPLVFLVLPAFGLLTVVPALLSGLTRT